MKHLKTKLMASVAMLMVATVMLSSASFAWFTISTAPEVKGVNTQLATNGNLEIALAKVTYDSTNGFKYTVPASSGTTDTGKNVTWGNTVDLSAYFATASDAVKNLRPVSFATASNAAPEVKSPVFGKDGRMSSVSELTPEVVAVNSSDTDAGSLVEFKGNNTPWAYRTDFMLRTNTDGQIVLADAAADLGNGAVGGGCFIKDKEDKVGTEGASYLKDIRVYAVVYKIKDDGSIDGDMVWQGTLLYDKLFNGDVLFNATANQIYLVQTYFLWDGANLNNADMASTGQDVKLNIQFEHRSTTGAADDLKSLLPESYKESN